jgi:hypothetical protein
VSGANVVWSCAVCIAATNGADTTPAPPVRIIQPS